jgi:glycosyltransferase involved in cell wall biosynthesis
MHILLIHQAFAALDEAGGTRHHELARYLVDRGHRVTVIASPVSYLTGTKRASAHWLERESGGPGIAILRTYTYAALHRSFFHRLLSFFSFMLSSFLVSMNIREVDLVWGTSPPIFQGATAWLVARLKRVPFLFEVRDLWPAFAIAVGVLRQPWLIRASLWLEKFLYQHADRLVVNSPGFIDHVLSRGARQVDLVPNGADPAMFDPAASGQEFRQQHDLGGKFVALYAGAHGLSNDLDVVLEAARLLAQSENIVFVLLGDGKEKPRLIEKARQMALDHVIFLSPLPKNQMGEALAAANACIAILKPVELYKTTYPNKVFDYMAAGRPVVLAIDGVIREVVETAGAGIPVPPGDPLAMALAIQALANDPERCHAMGRAGRTCIERRFSRAELAEKLAVIMEQMWRMHD